MRVPFENMDLIVHSKIKSDFYLKAAIGNACAGHIMLILRPSRTDAMCPLSAIFIFGATLPTGSINEIRELPI